MCRVPGGTVALVLASLLLGACSTDPPAPATPALSEGQPTNRAADFERAAAAEIAAAVAGRTERGIEDHILRLEAKLPGFGGVYLDSTGRVVLLAPAESTAASVKAVVQANIKIFSDLPPEAYQMLAQGNQVRVMPARYSFSQLVAWQQALDLGNGIVSLDANERTNRVEIGVLDSAAMPAATAAAQQAGIPAEAVSVVLDQMVIPAAGRNGEEPTEPRSGNSRVAPLPTTLQNYTGTVIGGTQIQTTAVTCTGGFSVRYTAAGVFVNDGLVTVSHCSPPPHGVGTDNFSVFRPDLVAFATVPPPQSGLFDFNKPFNHTPCSEPYCTRADAMLTKYAPNIIHSGDIAAVDTLGQNSQPGGITMTGTNWHVSGGGTPLVGAPAIRPHNRIDPRGDRP